MTKIVALSVSIMDKDQPETARVFERTIELRGSAALNREMVRVSLSDAAALIEAKCFAEKAVQHD